MGAWWVWVGLLGLLTGAAEVGGPGVSARVEDAPAQVLVGPGSFTRKAARVRGDAQLELEGRATPPGSSSGDAVAFRAVLVGEGVELEVELQRAEGDAIVERCLPLQSPLSPWNRDRVRGLCTRAPPAARISVSGRGRVLRNGQLVTDDAVIHVRVAVVAGSDGAQDPPQWMKDDPGFHVVVEGLARSPFPQGQLRFTFERGFIVTFEDGVVLAPEGALVTERGTTPGDDAESLASREDDAAGEEWRSEWMISVRPGRRRFDVLPGVPLPTLPAPEFPRDERALRLGGGPQAPVDATPRSRLEAFIRGPLSLFGGPEPLFGGPPPLFGGPPPLAGGVPPLFGGVDLLFGGVPLLLGGAPMLLGGPALILDGPGLLIGGPVPLQGSPPPLQGGPVPLNALPLEPPVPLRRGDLGFETGPVLDLDGGPALRFEPGPLLDVSAEPSLTIDGTAVRAVEAAPVLDIPVGATIGVSAEPVLRIDASGAPASQFGPKLVLETGPVLEIGRPLSDGAGTLAPRRAEVGVVQTPGTNGAAFGPGVAASSAFGPGVNTEPFGPGALPAPKMAQSDGVSNSGAAHASSMGLASSGSGSPVVVPLNARPVVPVSRVPPVVPLNAVPAPGP